MIRAFDFEERRLGNAEALPMYWTKVVGPGYPHYVNGRLTTDAAHGGRYSFRLDLNGGSVAYRYAADRIPVLPGAHYRVEGQVRTTVMPQARARLSGYLVDVDGHPIPASVRHTVPYAADAPDAEWRPLGLELSADDPKAAYLVLEVGLLQPAEYAASTLGQRALNAQDVYGTAWFDDLTVSQVPRVAMTTDRPGNVFGRGDPIRLTVRVDDRFTDDLAARIVVADADGRPVYQQTGTTDLARAEQVGPGRKRLRLDLPELPAGWYRATLTMTSRGQPLGTQAVAFVQLADAATPTVRPDRRFGFTATDLSPEAWDTLPDLLPSLAAGRVKLAFWGPQGDALEADPARFDELLDRLQARGVVPTASLLDLPPELARRLAPEGNVGVTEARGVGVKAGESRSYPDTPIPRHPDTSPSSWPLLARADPKEWQPRLAFLVSRHANHLDHWQLGRDGDESFVTDPDARRAYDAVRAEFRRLVQRPDLAMPWPAWYERTAAAPDSIALSVPASTVLPSQVPLYLNDGGAVAGRSTSAATATSSASGTAAPPRNVSVSLSWLDTTRYGRAERLRDMAQRVVQTLATGAGRIDLPLPLAVRREQDLLVPEPAEDLIVLRTIVTALAGTTYKGKVTIADDVEAFLFDRDGQGVLAVWDRGNRQRGRRQLDVDLGADPNMIDLWGNATPVQKATRTGGAAAGGAAVGGSASTNGPAGRKVTLTVSRTPMFLVDIDGQLMQTRASVSVDRPLIESTFQSHTRRLRFTNGYRSPVTGSVRLKPPPGWTVSPAVLPFALGPGERFEQDVTLELPYNTLAGPRTIDAQFILRAAGGDVAFAVPVGVSLGLSDVATQTVAVRDGDAVVVLQTITNYGDKPIDYTAYAILPGQPRQERLVTALAAGQATMKRYKFPAEGLKAGAKVRAGIKETAGMRILNDEVVVQ
ncbi:MAG: hypothetical protein JWO31_3066 [Phycisphaerales bacterium]|nr:hypothetical protein [Phycisphaerales bacterium]